MQPTFKFYKTKAEDHKKKKEKKKKIKNPGCHLIPLSEGVNHNLDSSTTKIGGGNCCCISSNASLLEIHGRKRKQKTH